MNDDILYEKLGHVRLITINRPAKMNSLNFAAHEALVDFWQEFNSDNFCQADIDQNGEVNIVDIVSVIGYILEGN